MAQRVKSYIPPKSNTNTFIYNNFIQGGLADGNFVGVKYSVAQAPNIDIRSEPGVVKLSHGWEKLSATIPEAILHGVYHDNSLYLFSKESGKIFKYDLSADTVTEVYEINALNGSSIIRGVYVYNDNIYIATQNWLHKLPLSGLNTISSSINLNWAYLNVLFSNGGEGDSYAFLDHISDAENNYLAFTAIDDTAYGVAFYLNEVPTSDLFMDIYTVGISGGTRSDSLGAACDNEIQCAGIQISKDNLQTGWNYYFFSSPMRLEIHNTYRWHIWTRDGTGSLAALTRNDLRGGYLKLLGGSTDNYKPMLMQNGVMFIGDDNYIHQVRQERFTSRALDIPKEYRVTALGKLGTDLLIGTERTDGGEPVQVFRWNTWSESYTYSDDIPEDKIDAFVYADNIVFFVGGKYKNVYFFDRTGGVKFKQLHVFDGDATVNPNAVTSWRGYAVIFMSVTNKADDENSAMAYLIGRRTKDYPVITTSDWYIDNTKDIEYYAVIRSPDNMYIVYKNNENGTIKIARYNEDIYAKEGELITRFMTVDSGYQNKAGGFLAVSYDSMPDDCNIELYYRLNQDDEWKQLKAGKDTKRNIVMSKERFWANQFQLKIKLLGNSENTPKITNILLLAR